MSDFSPASNHLVSPITFWPITFVMVMLAGLFLIPLPTSAAKIKAGPWLQAATETSMVIMWETDVSQPGKVDYGLDTRYGKAVSSQRVVVPPAQDTTGQDTQAVIHTAKLTGLQPNTTYHYRVKTDTAVSEDNVFHTNKVNGSYRVVHVSDTHTFRLGNTKQGLASIIAYSPDYVILSGDIANTSINNDYRKHFVEGYHLWKNTVHYTVKGNHDDRDWTTYSPWFHNHFPGAFSEDFYSFDIGPVHYIGINNNMREKDFPPASIDWLEKDLLNSRSQWKIVFMKANPAITWDDFASKRVEFLMPIFAKHGVDLVLTGGNSDGFKRQVNGVWYIHAGLGHNNGYWTLAIAKDGINLDYRQADGTATKSFSIGKPVPTNQPPVAVISANPTTGERPLQVTFDGKNSFDVDGRVASYAWDFGDGATATGDRVEHTYNGAGKHPVTLTVTDNAGRRATDTVTITVRDALNTPPIARVVATPTSGAPPLRVQFDAMNSTDVDGRVVSYAWTFGDGTTATGDRVQHTYSETGQYTATLKVTDDSGAADSDTVAIRVTTATPGRATEVFHPVADTYVYEHQPSTNYGRDTGLVIRDDSKDRVAYLKFDLRSIAATHASKALLKVHASYLTGPVPIKVFSVANDDWKELDMAWNNAPLPKTHLTTANVTSQGTYAFDITSLVAAELGGNKVVSVALLDDSGADRLVRFKSKENATGMPVLEVTHDGSMAVNELPLARIDATPITGEAPVEVSFDGSGSTDADGAIVSYEWDFGDVITAAGEIVHHTYNAAGDYTATLTVTDETGATDVASVEITVGEAADGIDSVGNGSFEAVDGDGQPVDWVLGNTQAWDVVTTEAFTGVRSLQLQDAHRQRYTPIASAMTVTLTPGTYTLGAWVATEALGMQDTERRGVRITLKDEALTSGSGNVAATTIVQGTHDWHWVSTRAVIGKAGEYTVKVWAHGKPNGTAWIDAVSLLLE
jgi:PKD repeat protein